MGVGPVDALIKAVKNALTSASDFWTELIDFHVEVVTSKESAIAKFLWKCVIKRGIKCVPKQVVPILLWQRSMRLRKDLIFCLIEDEQENKRNFSAFCEKRRNHEVPMRFFQKSERKKENRV